MIDYNITNRNIQPSQIMDVRAFTTPDIGSDHRLVAAKFRMAAQQANKPLPNIITKFNVEAFQNESTKYLYTKWLSEKLRNITLTTTATRTAMGENTGLYCERYGGNIRNAHS